MSLSQLHIDARLIHHDVKPDNLLLSSETGTVEDATAKLADFGL